MTKGSAVEQLYIEIKAELTNRTLLPGQRVDVADLCERYAISPTPMRNVLNRLVGERIVESRSHDGFYIPRITEASLRDLLAWNEFLLLSALDGGNLSSAPPPLRAPSADIVHETESLFNAVATLSANAELSSAVAGVHDRLRALRRLPVTSAIDRQNELLALRQLLSESRLTALRGFIGDYHAARQASLSQLIAQAYTSPVNTPSVHRGRRRPV